MEHLALFDTPVFAVEVSGCQDLHATLAAELVAEAAADPGLVVSNRGGWHSVPDLALRPDPAWRALSQIVVTHVRAATENLAHARGLEVVPPFGLSLTAWAMVMRDGDYTIVHDHPEATWSSAYYLDAGDADPEAHPESGVLSFVDPRRGASPVVGLDLFPTSFSIRPRTGLLVIFPGYLQHFVHSYRGQRPRVVVAANATLRVTPSR